MTQQSWCDPVLTIKKDVIDFGHLKHTDGSGLGFTNLTNV